VPGIVTAVNSALAGGLYPDLPVRALKRRIFPTARAETEASARLDQHWELAQRDVVALRADPQSGGHTATFIDPVLFGI
jgi:hypothetical protein